jgi:hypothetical protein
MRADVAAKIVASVAMAMMVPMAMVVMSVNNHAAAQAAIGVTQTSRGVMPPAWTAVHLFNRGQFIDRAQQLRWCADGNSFGPVAERAGQ